MHPSPGTPFPSRVRHAVEGLTPGYFALVMASGIISTGVAEVSAARRPEDDADAGTAARPLR